MVRRLMDALFRRHPLTAQFGIALLLAFATRIWLFGNPTIQIDEQFYLLVGDRMWRGAVPFVDIWDRKPVGTFLIYAAIRLLGGDGILQYQIVATLFAGITAFLIAMMALRLADARGAACAGGIYLLWLLIFDGAGGQTPVFYNAFMAGAAALTLSAIVAPARLALYGSGAMLLAGLAMQVKYSALFEGVFFGLVLLRAAFRTSRGWRFAVPVALLWIALALLPTALAYGWYIAAGLGDAFVYANFLSIFQRGSWPFGVLLGRMGTLLGLSLPLLLCAWSEWRGGDVRGGGDEARCFALGWLAGALAGLLVFGTYFTHYFLPVLVPLALVCAPLLGDRRSGVAIIVHGRTRTLGFATFLALAGLALVATTMPKRLKNRGDGAGVHAVAVAIRARPHGCLFVFDGEPILYHLTDACMVTTRIFPNHLNERVEQDAVGLDPIAEIRRILAAGTADIIVGSDRPDPDHNVQTLALVNAALRRDYRLVFRIRIGSRERIVYQRLRS